MIELDSLESFNVTEAMLLFKCIMRMAGRWQARDAHNHMTIAALELIYMQVKIDATFSSAKKS